MLQNVRGKIEHLGSRNDNHTPREEGICTLSSRLSPWAADLWGCKDTRVSRRVLNVNRLYENGILCMHCDQCYDCQAQVKSAAHIVHMHAVCVLI